MTVGTFSETQGDLFDYVGKTHDKIIYIPHVTNNQWAWGAGFVVPLGKLYPYAREMYIQDDTLELGKVQFVANKNHTDGNKHGIRNVIVANMCAQILGGKRPLHYNFLAKCMDFVASAVCHTKTSSLNNVEIVCPRFGSALAGGNWEFIKELIVDCWIRRGIDVKVFYL